MAGKYRFHAFLSRFFQRHQGRIDSRTPSAGTWWGRTSVPWPSRAPSCSPSPSSSSTSSSANPGAPDLRLLQIMFALYESLLAGVKTNFIPTRVVSVEASPAEDEDEDVARERRRVQEGGAQDDLLRVCDLSKVSSPSAGVSDCLIAPGRGSPSGIGLGADPGPRVSRSGPFLPTADWRFAD